MLVVSLSRDQYSRVSQSQNSWRWQNVENLLFNRILCFCRSHRRQRVGDEDSRSVRGRAGEWRADNRRLIPRNFFLPRRQVSGTVQQLHRCIVRKVCRRRRSESGSNMVSHSTERQLAKKSVTKSAVRRPDKVFACERLMTLQKQKQLPVGSITMAIKFSLESA